jgi:hypothetical protein
MLDGFHLVENIIANHDDHCIVVFDNAINVVHHLCGSEVSMTNVVSTCIIFHYVFIDFVMTISQKKAMSIASVSTYKDNVVHVFDPSRLGGTIVDFEDSFGMLCLRRNFQSTKTNFQCNLSLTCD